MGKDNLSWNNMPIYKVLCVDLAIGLTYSIKH